MFYSQFILAKKGPLGTIWIAAHLERKLRKNQVADTDIGVSVDSILSPDVPIALRLSSHLLLGVVRIYSRKVNYLFDDCSEALLKVKQAFRSAAVDLPPEESKAPYHSITLPETFDLDDFELPDNDIFQGNFVDHHVSSRDQITLQDTMEGVSYATPKFGLDERFGDGDASGLDLDEELFSDKIGTIVHANGSADPQSSIGSMNPLKQNEHPETRNINLGTMVDGDEEYNVDYAQAPCTPGLVEEPNLSNVQEVSAFDDHLESEYHLVESTMAGNAQDKIRGDKEEIDSCSHDNVNSLAIPMVLPGDNKSPSGGLDINPSKPHGEHVPVNDSILGSKPTSDSLHQIEFLNPASELVDTIMNVSDVPCKEDLQNAIASQDKDSSFLIEKPSDEHECPNEFGVQKSGYEGASVNDQGSVGVEVPGSGGSESDREKTCPHTSDLASENQDGSFLQSHETQSFQEPVELSSLNLDGHEKVGSTETPFLRPCKFNLEQPDTTSGCGLTTDADVQSDIAALAASEREETILEQTMHYDTKENATQEDNHAAASEQNSQVDNTTSRDSAVQNLNNYVETELPAPEKLLSVPGSLVHLHSDMLVKGSHGEIEEIDEGDTGSKTVTGKKRSFTESTLTEQSLHSVESSRLVRFKRTAESVPDDDDLLSSILVGRSSVLKVKPTPRLSEVTSTKRTRSAPRTSASKRKVLMDDTMVLHGDTIRQQLMYTEDIRRVRKKAPCSRPEISIIQKQYLEDDIFQEAIFTGMSTELASLHSKMYDLSGIRVSKDDPSLELEADPRLPFEDEKNDASIGTMAELMLASQNIENDASVETAAEPHLEMKNAENVENLDARDDMPTVMEEIGVGMTSELLLDGDNKVAVANPGENPLHSDQRMNEVDGTNEEVNISQQQTRPTNGEETNISHHELFLDVAGEHATQKNDDAVIADASTVLSDQNADAQSVELDSAVMGVYNDQAVSKAKVTENDCNNNDGVEIEPVLRDDVLSDMAQNGNNVELPPNTNHGELEYNDQSEIYGVLLGDHILDSSYPAQVGVQDDDLLNKGENAEEAYQPELDAETAGLGLHDHDEFKYSAAANDTEFLNVEDYELTDMADDYIPDDEETKFTENTGWSSRTRAVSKYLQTLFVKEAERGRKTLSMDNLLVGKSRKEASRMFFEALVLKTRDYIHVEQKNPFDDITIKPKTRLMKSDF